MKYQQVTEFEVRDYECDMQGIVNNSVYFNYLEHARHSYLKNKGKTFAELTQKGLNLVVVRAELDFKKSLRGDEQFIVGTNTEQESRLKIAFFQEIVKIPENILILKAKIIVTGYDSNGKFFYPGSIV